MFKKLTIGILIIIIITIVFKIYWTSNFYKKSKLHSDLGISMYDSCQDIFYKKHWVSDEYNFVFIARFEINDLDFEDMKKELNLKHPRDINPDVNSMMSVYGVDDVFADHAIRRYWYMKTKYPINIYSSNCLSNINNLIWWNPDTINYDNNYATFYDSENSVSKISYVNSNSRLTVQRLDNTVYLLLER